MAPLFGRLRSRPTAAGLGLYFAYSLSDTNFGVRINQEYDAFTPARLQALAHGRLASKLSFLSCPNRRPTSSHSAAPQGFVIVPELCSRPGRNGSEPPGRGSNHKRGATLIPPYGIESVSPSPTLWREQKLDQASSHRDANLRAALRASTLGNSSASVA